MENMTLEEVGMLRLVNQATAQGLVMAQHLHSRDILLFTPHGDIYRHPDATLVRSWLRHYAECGCYGRRCFDQHTHVCSCVPVLTPSYRGRFSIGRQQSRATGTRRVRKPGAKKE